ncbi:putative glutathione S-transferase, Thioredoxin-like superfamily, glutathione Transferase family [Septoria linicola]|nr:putative glutathione S-transferase, Thioredoxin-like superfamily, glutathione Transferase family [Septoria linicola]
MQSDLSLDKTFTITTSGTSTRPSTRTSGRRRKSSFHVTSFAFSVACKLLSVYQPPPPMRSIRPSSPVPSAISSVYSSPGLLPINVYGDITGPHLCKIVLIMKELHLPYQLSIIDVEALKADLHTPPDPNKGVPAIQDPNTGLVLCESGAIVEYLEDTYDQGSKLRYTSFPEKYQQKQWAWHQFGGHESLLGSEAFISVHEYYGNVIRGTLATIENHLNATGNLYLVGDRVTYADLMYVASKEVVASTLMESFIDDFEVEWRQAWPRTYDWYQRVMMRDAVKEALAERLKIMDERGWTE